MTFHAVLCHMEKAILLFLAQHLSSLIAKILLGSDERKDALAMEYGMQMRDIRVESRREAESGEYRRVHGQG